MSTSNTIRIKLLLTCAFCIAMAICFCQPRTIETKENAFNELNKPIADSSRQYIYNFLGQLHLSHSVSNKKMFDSAFFYFRKAVYLGDSLNRANRELTNESLRWLALTYLWWGHLAKSRQIYLQVIEKYQQNNQKQSEAETWFTMAKEYRNINVNLTEIPEYFDRAISIYDNQKLYQKEVEAMVEKMVFYTSHKDLSKAKQLEEQILAMSREDRPGLFPEIHLMLSGVHRYNGNYSKALEYMLKSLNYIDSSGDKQLAHYVYGELALTYDALEEPDRSIFWYKKCIAEREKKGMSRSLIYRTVSLLIKQMVKGKKAAEAITELQNLNQRIPPLTHLQKAILAQSLAYCYTDLKQYKLAESEFLRMLAEYNQSTSLQEILFIAYYDVAKFYIDRHEYARGDAYLNGSFKMEPIAISQKRDIQLLNFKVDSAKGNLASALLHYQAYKSLNDSLFTEAKGKQINELMIRYETEKKEKDILKLENEATRQNEKLAQSNQTRNWILGAAVLLCIIVGLLINNSLVKQSANKKLEIQQKEIRQQNASLQHLLKEKEWLLKEIHHRVKNNLHTVIGLLHTQSGFLRTPEAVLAIKDSQHRIQTMSLIHEKLFQSGNLSTVEMSWYIFELVGYLKHSFDTGQRILFKLDTVPLELKLSHSLPLGLILNEAITNSIKYAFPDNRTGTIIISLKNTEASKYILTIADNGKGLAPGFDAKKNSTMGMNLMEGLTEDIHGLFSIKNNNGTEINIQFTYEPSVADDPLMQKKTNSTQIT